ncbi:MAG: phage virion morphogenesis protein [Cyanobacteria bacterium P01_H01_bin.121]
MQLEFTLDQTSVRQALSGLDRDFSPLYKAWGDYLFGVAADSFRQQRSPSGQPWQQLKEATYRRKRQRRSPRSKYPNSILRDTGVLRDTLAAQPLPDGVEVGTNRPVGRYSLGAIHQFGAPRRNIPSRPFLPLGAQGEVLPEAVQALEQQLIEFISR